MSNYHFSKKKSKKTKTSPEEISDNNAFESTKHLQDKLKILKKSISHSPDVIFRQFRISNSDWEAAIIYIDGLVDKTVLQEQILKPLMGKQSFIEHSSPTISDVKIALTESVISIGEVKKELCLNTCILEILSGNAVLLIDNAAEALILGIIGGASRSIETPSSEDVVRGPRDGFTETLRTNTSLIRRRIKDPNLTMVNYKVGQRTQTNLSLIYIKGLTNHELVKEIQQRIERIDIDEMTESGFIEQLIEDNYLTPFPQMQHTERPDRVVSALIEGRVTLLLDGTPFALIAPVTFSMLMTSSEDYYERWIPTSLIRILRYGAAFIALFLPSLYIALISYNHGLIPTKLVMSIAAGREGVPFPSIVEGLIMEIILEILREAGLRLPKQIGQTIGIVGGLVIGQAAVQAGIVSPIMVIVVALTAISSFTCPQYSVGITIRTLRFGMMIMSAIFGLYGIILCYIFIMNHLVKLKSFGVNYLSPFAPYRPDDWKDSLIRMPLKTMKSRPKANKTQDNKRQ
ncbi:spore germination protein [Bacillus thuringiensis]|uniref:spore germination protein n=1 Tax=Bacillus thuringiensis TaxID=1428 RepID=UPI003AA97495